MARNLVYIEIAQENKEKIAQLSKITGLSESDLFLSILGIDKEKINSAIKSVDFEKMKKEAVKTKVNKLLADIGITKDDLKSLFQ